jgi:FlaA1/EpsC-like NDP-sugar epimerase
MHEWLGFYAGRKVAITGAAGTVGRELVKQLLQSDAEEIRLLDNAESALYALEGEINDCRAHCFVVDTQHLQQLERFVTDVDDLFHCAAYKHVPACERNPLAAVQNNIVAVQNVITASRNAGVKRVLFTSSDKAVNPTNVMGTSKLMGERLITAANTLDLNNDTVFASTRFGNVLGSSGSVIPIFRRQIVLGQPITLTHREMSRFVMTPSESALLVLRSLQLAQGGEVFITKMPALNIFDLAERMRAMLAPSDGEGEIKIIGARPGEKLFEELMTEEEMARAYVMEDFIVVLPAFRNIYDRIDYSAYLSGRQPEQVYRSDHQILMDSQAIDALLEDVLSQIEKRG